MVVEAASMVEVVTAEVVTAEVTGATNQRRG
jgi:hypothetical protein